MIFENKNNSKSYLFNYMATLHLGIKL